MDAEKNNMIDRNTQKAIKEIVLCAGKMMVEARDGMNFSKEFKKDGSPVTDIDKEIQRFIRTQMEAVSPHPVIGEEEVFDRSLDTYWAVDPIDGTWAFISYENTSVINLSFIEGNQVKAGIVYNPFTREFFSSFGSETKVNHLDLPIIKNDEITIVNFTPSRTRKIDIRLFELLRQGQIKKLTAIGGSISYAMCLVAKGSFSNYIVHFTRKADPWDFSASYCILEQAGGVITDSSGHKIDPLSHKGFIVASDNTHNHERFLSQLNDLSQS